MPEVGREGIYHSPDDATGMGPDFEEQEQEAMRRLAQQEEWARGSPSIEALRSASKPELVLSIASDIMGDYEDLERDEAHDRYSLKYYYSAIEDRARALSLSKDELKRRGIIEVIPDGTVVTKVPGFSIETRHEKKERVQIQTVEERTLDEAGGVKRVDTKERRTKETVIEPETVYGTDEQRRVLAETYRAAEDMMVVREKLADLFNYAYLPNTAALAEMTETFYIKASKFSNAQLRTLFRLPDFSRPIRTPEDLRKNTVLGDHVDLALRLLYIVSMSETKEKILALMSRPGWKEIVFSGMTDNERDKAVKDWIGDVNGWEIGSDRYKKTTEAEDEKEIRGRLTKFGNIYAKGDRNEEQIILRQIKLFVMERYMKGTGIDRETAERFATSALTIAYEFFKISGLAAELGIERYQKVKLKDKPVVRAPGEKPGSGLALKDVKRVVDDVNLAEVYTESLALEGDPQTDDLTKLFHFRGYREKEYLKGTRSVGPEITIPLTEERIAVSLLRLARSKIENGQWRSFIEQWWGYPPEGGVTEEKAKRLGEMDWEISVQLDEQQRKMLEQQVPEIGLDPKKAVIENIWSWYTLFLYLAGRKDPIKGIYLFTYAEDFDPSSFMSPDFWRHKNKFLPIVINSFVKSNGEYRELYRRFGSHDNVEESLRNMVDQSFDNNRRNFWKGVESLPKAAIWKVQTVKAREETAAGTSTPEKTIWEVAKNVAKSSGFPTS
jgi:hypothetical protein